MSLQSRTNSDIGLHLVVNNQ